MTILGFSRREIFVVATTLSIIGIITFSNLQISLRRSRDIQRGQDLWRIVDALVSYHEDMSSFPPSFEGRIVACFGGVDEDGVPQAAPCDWHSDAFGNIYTGAEYLAHLPTDPKHNEGSRYYYISNGRTFQIYGALEGEDEAEYSPAIVKRNIMCGNKVCNTGRGFGQTPLDKSIEEYENEMRELQKIRDEQTVH